MIIFKAIPREEMQRAHERRRPRARAEEKAPAVKLPRQLNLGTVLDLGNTTYFVFRGRPYGVPPVPYKLGQEIWTLVLELRRQGVTLVEANTPTYYILLRRLPRLLWSHMRCVGVGWRMLRRLGLLANPLERASEAELMEIAHFFLARRMKSGVRFQAELIPTPSQRRKTV